MSIFNESYITEFFGRKKQEKKEPPKKAESYSGKYGNNTSYSPYYDSEGNLCKYINEEFVPIKEE